jgi:hypothetical protein
MYMAFECNLCRKTMMHYGLVKANTIIVGVMEYGDGSSIMKEKT